MLSSIHPLGERTRNNRWSKTAAFYIAGSSLGGITIGAIAGASGWLGLSWWAPTAQTTTTAMIAILIVALTLDFQWLGLRLPTIHRQVNEDWLTMYRSWVYGGGFGFQLGLGVVTIVPTAATYATLAFAIMSQNVFVGATIGLAFGLARSLPILTLGRINSGSSLRTYHRRVNSLSSVADRMIHSVMAATIVGLAVGAML